MEKRLLSRSIALMVTGTAVALLLGFGVIRLVFKSNEVPRQATEAALSDMKDRAPPSLDCGFQPFFHNSTAVSFYFDVVLQKGDPPRFYQRLFVSADGTRERFEGDNRPIWTYSLDSDGNQTITSPDGATVIVVYGLKLGSPGVLSIEAGIRSNVFRNLGGQCRQSHLADSSAQ